MHTRNTVNDPLANSQDFSLINYSKFIHKINQPWGISFVDWSWDTINLCVLQKLKLYFIFDHAILQFDIGPLHNPVCKEGPKPTRSRMWKAILVVCIGVQLLNFGMCVTLSNDIDLFCKLTVFFGSMLTDKLCKTVVYKTLY